MRERDPMRVVHWGLGAVGLGMAQLVWRRAGLMPVGAIDDRAENAGRDLGDLIGFDERMGVQVNNDPVGVLTAARPDVTLIATRSRIEEVAPQVLQAMEAGSNVICVAEEMTYPWATRPDLADSLDELAHAHGVTVLGTGVNPGFVLDTLTIALTGCCADVERIRGSRAIDLTAFDDEAYRSQGVGLSPSEFAAAVERGRVVGHVGFEQSIHLIADALGWRLERIDEAKTAIIAQDRREGERLRVEPGQAAGCLHTATGYVNGLPRIVLEHSQEVLPQVEAVQTGDFLDIEGQPNIRMAIQPEIAGLKGTVAIAVNMISAVLQTGPGLMTMLDMPVPRAVLGDLREMIGVRGPTIEEELARGWTLPGLGGQGRQGEDQTGIESP